VDPFNYTTYETSPFLSLRFWDGCFTRDASGNFYGRKSDFKYYKVAPNGTETFLAGDGNTDYAVFTPGLGAAARFGANGGVKDIVIDSSGNLFTVHTATHRIIKIAPNGNMTSFAGTGTEGFDDGPANSATFTYPWGIVIDASNTLYVSESGRKTIRKITSTGEVSTLTYSLAFSPSFYKLAVDSSGVIYALDLSLHRVYKITPTGPSTADIALLAGSTAGYANGQGSVAQFNSDYSSGICVDTFGNVYVGDSNNGSVRKITPSGLVSTIVGNATNAASVVAETNTQLYYPGGVVVDTNGVVYVATVASIRKISPVFSLANAGQTDSFVVKYNSDGIPLWARRVGGTGSEDSSVTTDSSGNIVVAGYYSSNPLTIFNADGTTFTTLANGGGNDGFVVKYNSEGTPLWARRVGGTGGESMSSVSTDSSGNIVVTGYCSSNPVTIYNANGSTFTTLTNLGDENGFVLKYNSAGTPQWARRLDGTPFFSNTINSSGNIVVTGYYSGTIVTPSVTLTSSGSIDICIVNYDSTGTLQWARKIGGVGLDAPKSVTTDSSGNIVVTGYFQSGTLTIFAPDGTTAFTTLTNSGSADGFVVKYNSEGTPLWARRMGGEGNDKCNSVTTDSSGNIVVAGYYSSNPLTIFNADGTTFTTLANLGAENAFIVKYNPAGTPQWARRVGGTANDSMSSVSTDSSGNIVVTGYCSSNPVTIYNANGTTFTTLVIGIGGDVFVVKYDSTGTPLWAKSFGGNGFDSAKSIKTDSTGNIVVTGQYSANPLKIT
jgi:uncharacterized delta-60 repeat protein